MDRLQRAALLTSLMSHLRERGSWCGETHVQKSVLFLQEVSGVPLGYDFILYKHGPFSFDLRDELTALRADGLVRLEPQSPYGPRLAPTERSNYIQQSYPKTLHAYGRSVECVAETLGPRGVADLERLATALFITKHKERFPTEADRASVLCKLKPHISQQGASEAVAEVDQILASA